MAAGIELFLETVEQELSRFGYAVYREPHNTTFEGVSNGLLYARSSARYRLGFARVEDHFLFVDGGIFPHLGLEALRAIYEHFRMIANQGFRTPPALRMQIPNLVLVIVSGEPFHMELIDFVRRSNLTPGLRGEVGQWMLVDIRSHRVTRLDLSRFLLGRTPGWLPLSKGAETLVGVIEKALKLLPRVE